MRALLRTLALIVAIAAAPGCGSKKGHHGAAREPKEADWRQLKFEGETFGRFVGTVVIDQLGVEQFVKLDFVPSRVARTNELMVSAVMSFYFGGFESTEYTTYHFDDIRYNLLTGKLVFNQNDQYVSLITQEFSKDGLVGELHAGGRRVGILTMNRVGATPTKPTIETVAGDYRGQCDNNPTSIHLWTSRSVAESARIGNPFGQYDIHGTVGDRASQMCGVTAAEGDRNCVTDVIRAGAYDYFAGSMRLLGTRQDYVCTVDGTFLDCGRCKFDRVTPPSAKPGLPPAAANLLLGEEGAPITQDGAAAPLAGVTTGIAGAYFGYVHHERLNLYQRATLDIQTFQSQDGVASHLVMAATAQLIFGEPTSGQNLRYAFLERDYDIREQIFVFERIEDDVDAVIQVTQLRDGAVRGVWFSQQYGRVGTFELFKSGYAPLPPDAIPYPELGGNFRGTTLEVSVAPRLDTTPVNSLNPLFPITFGGSFRFPDTQSAWTQIDEGSFDFYTGKIGFKTANQPQTLVGVMDPLRGMLLLAKPSRIAGVLQEAYVTEDLGRLPR